MGADDLFRHNYHVQHVILSPPQAGAPMYRGGRGVHPFVALRAGLERSEGLPQNDSNA